MTASILPELMEKLELYLKKRVACWLAQPEGSREPTLPTTKDGKVCALAVARESDIGENRVQHLHKRPELRSAVNAVAFEQGIKPIKTLDTTDDMEKEAVARIRLNEKRSSELSKLVAEQAATIERQRSEIRSLREQLRAFEETGQIIRTRAVLP
jgi:uncharacterized coiled-coil protein SlyX